MLIKVLIRVQNSMMDADVQRLNTLRPHMIARSRRAWGPETSGGHQLTDPSPPAENTAESKHIQKRNISRLNIYI